jgi:hypothetical protein
MLQAYTMKWQSTSRPVNQAQCFLALRSLNVYTQWPLQMPHNLPWPPTVPHLTVFKVFISVPASVIYFPSTWWKTQNPTTPSSKLSTSSSLMYRKWPLCLPSWSLVTLVSWMNQLQISKETTIKVQPGLKRLWPRLVPAPKPTKACSGTPVMSRRTTYTTKSKITETSNLIWS